MRLVDKSVFITGGTGSIGQALVEAFCAEGARVTFQYHQRKDDATALESRLGARGIALDLGTDFTVPAISPDILVNNAGINESQVVTHLVDLLAWKRALAVNLTAPFRLCHAYLPAMMANGWGRVVNISSIYGLQASDTMLPYNATKHGLSGLTKTVAREYARYGITCNEICPGPVESAMVERLGSVRASTAGISLEQYLKDLHEEIPAGRLARPGDVGEVAVFLASQAASYVNGVSLRLDGGLLA